MKKCADGSRRFVPHFHFGDRPLKTRRFNHEWRLAIGLHGNLFGTETAGRRFFAPQPQPGRFRFQPIRFAEAAGQFRRRRPPIQSFHLAVVMHAAVSQTNHASRLRQHRAAASALRTRAKCPFSARCRRMICQYLPTRLGIHMLERFVHHQHRRVGGQRAGDRQPRLFAGRKRVGTAVAAVRQIKLLPASDSGTGICLCVSEVRFKSQSEPAPLWRCAPQPSGAATSRRPPAPRTMEFDASRG